MGLAEIPPDPSHAGKISVRLELDRNETLALVDKLKAALKAATDGADPFRINGNLAKLAIREPAAVPQVAVQQAPLAGLSMHATTATAAPVAAPAGSDIRHAVRAPRTRDTEQAMSRPAQHPAPSPPPSTEEPTYHRTNYPNSWDFNPASSAAAPPTVAAVSSAPPVATPAQSQERGQLYNSEQRPRQQQPLSGWQRCWSTDAEDHSGQDVTALVYAPTIQGLPGGDGHGGWLLSSSRELLNFWECSIGAGASTEPALTVMHSQMTECRSVHLAVEPATRSLLGAAAPARGQGGEFTAVHALTPEAGFLTVRLRLPMPPASSPAPAQPPATQQHRQVVSLDRFQGPLRGCCAGSHGTHIAVYSTTSAAAAGAAAPKPKANWAAHPALVTALHRSEYGCQLFSGAADGSIHVWDLKGKPTAPVSRFSHAQAITGIELVNESTLVTCSADTRLKLWDLRRPAEPLRTVIPDTRPLLKLATSPVGDCIAVASTSGLFAVDLMDMSGTVTPISREPLSRAVQGLCWNSTTGYLYAAEQAGITVWRRFE